MSPATRTSTNAEGIRKKWVEQSAHTHDLQGGFQLQQDRLADEDFSGLQAQASNFCFCEIHILAGALPTNRQQPLDDIVYINDDRVLAFWRTRRHPRTNAPRGAADSVSARNSCHDSANIS